MTVWTIDFSTTDLVGSSVEQNPSSKALIPSCDHRLFSESKWRVLRSKCCKLFTESFYKTLQQTYFITMLREGLCGHPHFPRGLFMSSKLLVQDILKKPFLKVKYTNDLKKNGTSTNNNMFSAWKPDHHFISRRCHK